MSTQFNLNENKSDFTSQGRVKVTDLLNRLNEEKKVEKKRKSSSRSCSCLSGNCFWYNSHNLN